MLNTKLILLSQYPAFLLMSLLFLISYLAQRKRSAVKSVFSVLMFGVSLAAGVVCCFMGIQGKYWTLKTLFPLSMWSWIGVAVVAVIYVVHLIHAIEKKHSQYVMEKQLKKAEKQKDEAIEAARQEGRDAARAEAEAARAAEEEAARAAEEAARAAEEAAKASAEEATADPNAEN